VEARRVPDARVPAAAVATQRREQRQSTEKPGAVGRRRPPAEIAEVATVNAPASVTAMTAVGEASATAPATQVGAGSSPVLLLRELLRRPQSLRTAFLLTEVFGQPLARRGRGAGRRTRG